MPVWPKSFYTFGISLRTAATEWKLRDKRSAPSLQQKTFARLVRRLAGTSHWKAAGVESGMSYAVFRTRVPLHNYDALAPAIARMKRGESDVLWPGRCALFATTAGTSSGRPRSVPVTEEMVAHVRSAGFDSALFYTVRARHAGAFRGRHLLFGSPTALHPVPESQNQCFEGDLSGIAALSLPGWAERHFYEPGPAAAHEDWSTQLEAIIARTSTQDISLVAGLPPWLLLLANALLERTPPNASLQALWPNLEACVHTGVPIAPYLEQLRGLLGNNVKFHELYAATEGCIAAQDGEAHQGLRLMADRGLFFEFLSLADFDNNRLEQLGPKALALGEVKPNVDYAVLLTTPAGFARYVLGDIVRFTSVTPPRLIYVGGTTLRLNAFAENVSEKDVTDALTAVCQRRGWLPVNFHVAPLFQSHALTGQQRGRHEWWVELKPGSVATPTGPHMAAELELDLQRSNETYAARRRSGTIEAPVVRLVMPGVFGHWLRYHRGWGGQRKVPRCRSDRLVADQLAEITHFARD